MLKKAREEKKQNEKKDKGKDGGKAKGEGKDGGKAKGKGKDGGQPKRKGKDKWQTDGNNNGLTKNEKKLPCFKWLSGSCPKRL